MLSSAAAASAHFSQNGVPSWAACCNAVAAGPSAAEVASARELALVESGSDGELAGLDEPESGEELAGLDVPGVTWVEEGPEVASVGAVGGGGASMSPALSSAASFGAVGAVGLHPEPEPAEPPLLIKTGVPDMVTPAGPTTMNPPPAFSVMLIPASITMFIPAFKWIS